MFIYYLPSGRIYPQPKTPILAQTPHRELWLLTEAGGQPGGYKFSQTFTKHIFFVGNRPKPCRLRGDAWALRPRQHTRLVACLIFVIPVFKILAFGLGFIWCVENLWPCGEYCLGEFEPDPVHIRFFWGPIQP
jgi:hypothetical protein